MFLFKANKLTPNVPIRLECLDENVDDILKNISDNKTNLVAIINKALRESQL